MIADAVELYVILAAVEVCQKARLNEKSVDAMVAVYARTVVRDRNTMLRVDALVDAVFSA